MMSAFVLAVASLVMGIASEQRTTYETWTDREYVYHAAADAQVDEFIVQIDRAGSPNYVMQDLNLNVVGLFGPIGVSTQMLRQDVYSPYGEVAAMDYFSQSIADNKVGRKGMFFDRLADDAAALQLQPGAKGIYRYRNRSYSPTLGRFLQRDPNATAMPLLMSMAMNGRSMSFDGDSIDLNSHYGDGMNLYGFVRGNPINGSDPMGLSLFGDILGSTAVRASFAALNAVGVAAAGVTFADNALFGVGLYGAVQLAAIEYVEGRIGGKTFDAIANGAQGVLRVLRAGGEAAKRLRQSARTVARAADDISDAAKQHLNKVLPHREAKKLTKGFGGEIHAHHILERRHAKRWGFNPDDVPYIILTKTEHQVLTGRLNQLLPPNGRRYEPSEVLAAYGQAYGEIKRLDLLAEIDRYFR